MNKEVEPQTAPEQTPTQILDGLIKRYQEEGNYAAATLLESVQETAQKGRESLRKTGLFSGMAVGTGVASWAVVSRALEGEHFLGVFLTFTFCSAGGAFLGAFACGEFGSAVANHVRNEAIKRIKIANQPEQASLEGPKNV